MDKKLIGLFSNSNSGCTFLDWSIHFLNGRSKYYKVSEGFIPLTNNPITKFNAHNHRKNHFVGVEKHKKSVDNFLNNTDAEHNLLSLYPGKAYNKIIKQLNLNDLTTEDYISVIKLAHRERLEIWNYLVEKNAKLISIHSDPRLKIFNNFNRLEFWSIDDVFFKKSKSDWNEINLNTIWDQRERLALDMRPLGEPEGLEIFPRNDVNLTLSVFEWFYYGKTVIKQVMQFCELDIDTSRYDQWVSIYEDWQDMLKRNLIFDYQLPIIIESIVNNYYHELPELTLQQEAMIQHFLIYQHNVNLKTWQLTKFPNNTQDLYKLLEPNIHPVENIYNKRSTT